jgi:SOS1/NGEF-like PH domain
LLLREVLKHTDPEVPEYQEIADAKRHIDATVEAINEGKRIKENQMAVVEIADKLEGLREPLVTPTRRLVQSGTLALHHTIKSKGEARFVFFFNDLIVVCRENKSKQRYAVKVVLPFPSQARFIVLSDQEKIKNAFEIEFEQKRYIFCAESKEKQLEWTGNLKLMLREYQQKRIEGMKRERAQAETNAAYRAAAAVSGAMNTQADGSVARASSFWM